MAYHKASFHQKDILLRHTHSHNPVAAFVGNHAQIALVDKTLVPDTHKAVIDGETAVHGNHMGYDRIVGIVVRDIHMDYDDILAPCIHMVVVADSIHK